MITGYSLSVNVGIMLAAREATMAATMKSAKDRLIKVSEGNFSIAHKALQQVKRKSKSKDIDLDEVIKIIERNLATTKKAS